MDTQYDVVVVGAGVMGCATAYWLAQEGRSVCLLEQFQIGHGNGSSHGTSRIFRFSYPEARYVEMAMESKGLWNSIEERSGERLLAISGGLDIGQDIEENAKALDACGAPFEFIDGAESSRRFPMISVPAGEPVLYQPDAGIARADRAVATLSADAKAAGAEVREQAKATALDPSNGVVEVVLEQERISARAVVVTAGAWVRKLLGPLGIDVPVRPTRETVAYFRIQETPPTLVEWGDPSVYALPGPGEGLKAGEHIAGPVADPDDARKLDEDSIARLSAWVAERFPTADARSHRAENCFYTNTEDQSFILERHGRVVVGSACSGHGFKFAPLVGRRLAALATEII